MTLRIIIILSILTILSCADNRYDVSKRKNHIYKISFATSGCYGKCPFLAIEIDSSLSYKFYGGRYTQRQGFFIGTITKEFWDSLNDKFEQTNFEHLDTLYNGTIDDMAIECYITNRQSKKLLYAQEMDLPDSVRIFFYWLMDTYKILELHKVDTLAFETKIQFGQGPIPPPKNMKFKPPRIEE